jgi:hypothetical protein
VKKVVQSSTNLSDMNNVILIEVAVEKIRDMVFRHPTNSCVSWIGREH